MLEGLIERVERANAEMQGALLEEAWDACAEADQSFRRFACAPCTGFGTNGGRFGSLIDARAYLDAAMMLVPEGYSFEVRRSGSGDKGQATIWNPMRAPGESEWRVYGCATPALALCAASLRAKASS